jgi:hypothetical protein
VLSSLPAFARSILLLGNRGRGLRRLAREHLSSVGKTFLAKHVATETQFGLRPVLDR